MAGVGGIVYDKASHCFCLFVCLFVVVTIAPMDVIGGIVYDKASCCCVCCCLFVCLLF